MITFGSLFAGIGGFDLGFERAGMKCLWQVEIDDYATKVLEKHWPDVARFRDVRECGAVNLQPVDVICGGFPCQDISQANATAEGISGERSGLWFQFARIVRELKPRWVVVENVARLLSINDGWDFGEVLRTLAESGYSVEWDVLPASAFGAPHIRERVIVIAWNVAHAESERWGFRLSANEWVPNRAGDASRNGGALLGYTASQGLPDGAILPMGKPGKNTQLKRSDWWITEPAVGRVAHGVPARVDRLRCLGNAVVPQVAEWLGRCIVECEA